MLRTRVYQVRSSQVHLVIEPLIKSGYDVALFLYTKPTSHAHHLLKWYEPHITHYRLLPPPLKQMDTFFSVLNQVCGDGGRVDTEGPFDGILTFRFDLVFKPRFADVWSSLNENDMKKVLWSFRTWKRDEFSRQGNPRVADMLCYIPMQFCHTIATLPRNELNEKSGHELWDDLKPIIGENNLGFMLTNEQYDSDPSKDWNPLYSLAERVEAPHMR
jgi:hypothetical protein